MAKKTFSPTLLTALGEQLRTLPRIEKQDQEKSRVESIRDLAADIRAAQRNGYSLAQIADSLTSGGLAISEATLKNYLGKAPYPHAIEESWAETSGDDLEDLIKLGGECAKARVLATVVLERAAGRKQA